MGTTPNFDTTRTGGTTAGTGDTTDTGTSTVRNADMNAGSNSGGMTDDVSLSHPSGDQSTSSMQQGEPGSSAKETMKRGAEGARDAMEQLQQKVSDITSRFINDIDVDDLTRKLESQVREHPGRTLAMAIGAGFLLGRAVRR